MRSTGRPDALVPAVHSMFKLRDQALVLLANPLPDELGRHAGPTFEWDRRDDGRKPCAHAARARGTTQEETVIFPRGAARQTDHGTASETVYDAVVVGAGISGAIMANELSRAGKRVGPRGRPR